MDIVRYYFSFLQYQLHLLVLSPTMQHSTWQIGNMTTVEPLTNTNNLANCTDDPFTLLAQFSSTYHQLHAYLSLIMCLLGICLNGLNVAVLCQRHMRNSNNLLLSSLAISDGLVMFIYIIYDLGFRVVPRLETGMTKDYAYLLLVCIVGQNLFHTFSTWIIVVLAAYRLFYVHAGPQARVVCTPMRVWLAVASMGLISIILAIPLIFAHEVTLYRSAPQGTNMTGLYEVDYVGDSVLQSILFFNSALLVKAIPILLMSILSTILIRKIRETRMTRRRLVLPETLRSTSTPFQQSTSLSASIPLAEKSVRKIHWFFFKSCGRGGPGEACRQSLQPTRMLLAVMVMYIVTYFPQVGTQFNALLYCSYCLVHVLNCEHSWSKNACLLIVTAQCVFLTTVETCHRRLIFIKPFE